MKTLRCDILSLALLNYIMASASWHYGCYEVRAVVVTESGQYEYLFVSDIFVFCYPDVKPHDIARSNDWLVHNRVQSLCGKNAQIITNYIFWNSERKYVEQYRNNLLKSNNVTIYTLDASWSAYSQNCK